MASEHKIYNIIKAEDPALCEIIKGKMEMTCSEDKDLWYMFAATCHGNIGLFLNVLTGWITEPYSSMSELNRQLPSNLGEHCADY